MSEIDPVVPSLGPLDVSIAAEIASKLMRVMIQVCSASPPTHVKRIEKVKSRVPHIPAIRDIDMYSGST